MSLNHLGNCPRCGKIYVRTLMSEICPACMRNVEVQFEQCANYLRDHRGTTLQELSDATGVSNRQIGKFIREGRISIDSMPNMSYPCESCGTLIREHSLCGSCRSRLAKEVKNMDEDDLRKRERENKEQTISFRIRDHTDLK